MALGSRALWLPLFAGGIGFLGLALFLALFMPETGFRPRQAQERGSWRALGGTAREGVGIIRSQPALGLVLGVATIGISSVLMVAVFAFLLASDLVSDFVDSPVPEPP